MIQSMTGYGKATAELPDKKINVEIKSLNSKAMDLSTRIAPAYREKEIEIRNEISKVLERGKADFSLWIEKKEGADAAPINKDVLKSYYSQLESISRELEIPCPAPEDWLQLLLRMPDVMTKTEIQELTEEEWSMVPYLKPSVIWSISANRRGLHWKRNSVRRLPTSTVCSNRLLLTRKNV